MWLELQIFGFRALWSPYFMMFVVGLGVLYYLITGPYRHKFGGQDRPSVKQQSFFYIGLLLLYIVKGAPIDLMAHIMLTAHMIQMAIFYFVFPILIIYGLPSWIWKKIINLPVIGQVLKLVTNPLISLILFCALFSFYHIPMIFDFAKSSQITHSTISSIILIAAFIMWLPVLEPIKEFKKMKPLVKLAYIAGNGLLITPACALIIFAEAPIYAAYSSSGAWIQSLSLCVPGNVLDGLAPSISGPEMFSPLSLLEDQQAGGIIMKIMQEIVLGIMLASVFFPWFNQGSLKIDPIPPMKESESHS
ncbi:MAG TPA: cytochrome c oxidase assembly factor CtaG [Virgibacillus sp.]|nr:cytochrome c oxidase assembly factor CtaG [Virgibacillus sp.]